MEDQVSQSVESRSNDVLLGFKSTVTVFLKSVCQPFKREDIRNKCSPIFVCTFVPILNFLYVADLA